MIVGTLYRLRLSEIKGKEEVLYQLSDRGRQEKASRYLREADRLRCLSAGYLMKSCLPSYAEDRLRTGKDGKPYLWGGPPFSLSHGGNYTVLFRDDQAEEVGADVESVKAMDACLQALPYYATKEERAEIGSDGKKALYVWTRKESLYKTVGEGISDFRELPSVLKEEVLFCERKVWLYSFEEDGHIFSIASCGENASREIEVTEAALL